MKKLLILLLLYSINITSQLDARNVYTTEKLDEEPKIDGKLDDKCWGKGEWKSNFIQRIPRNKDNPSQETRFKILYNENNLYIAFMCFDNDSAKQDESYVYQGDLVGVVLDTYNDKKNAYEFVVSSIGSKMDLTVSEEGKVIKRNLDWNPIWEHKTDYTSFGWTVEIKIPFNQISYPQKQNMAWGLMVWRFQKYPYETNTWPYIPMFEKKRISYYGGLKGFKDLKGGEPYIGMEGMPYSSGRYSINPKTDNPLDEKSESSNKFGFAGKIRIGKKTNIEYSFNPDFGDVEPDSVNFNTSVYETYQNEKRPFFKNGSDVFDFDIDDNTKLFYSRRIGQLTDKGFNIPNNNMKYPQNTDVYGVIKALSLKDSLKIGFITALTSDESAESIDTSGVKTKNIVEPLANYSMFRFQKQFKNDQSISGIITNTRRINQEETKNLFIDNAFTGGLDYQKQWKNSAYYFNIKAVFSNVIGSQEALSRIQKSGPHNFLKRANQSEYDSVKTTLTGAGTVFTIGKTNKLYSYKTTFVALSPELELNDIGYMTRADYMYLYSDINYENPKRNRFLNYFSFDIIGKYSLDFSPNPTGFDVIGKIYGRFHNNYGLGLSFISSTSNIDNYMVNGGPSIRTPDNQSYQLRLHSDMRENATFDVNGEYRKYSDNISSRLKFSSIFKLKANKKVTLSLNGVYENMVNDMQYVDNVDSKFICANLDRHSFSSVFRINYDASSTFNIQYYLQAYLTYGEYKNFKAISDTPTEGLYSTRFDNYHYTYEPETNKYNMYLFNPYFAEILDNPDFTIKSLTSNISLKYEFLRGFSLFFVWSNSVMYKDSHYNNSSSDYFKIMDSSFKNTFMLRLNYWFKM